MTTIIAIQGKLVADRRKAVNYFKAGIVGVRDEPKIHKLPFCIYGTTGFELLRNAKDKLVHQAFEKKLAMIFGLTYFCDAAFLKHPLVKASGAEEKFVSSFRKRAKALRDIIGHQLADEMESGSKGVIAMGLKDTIIASDREFQVFSNQEPLVLGSGKKAAIILLDHGWSFERIYNALRESGCPTGETFDILDTRTELVDSFPPVTDNNFIYGLINAMNTAWNSESYSKRNPTPEEHQLEKDKLAELIAIFLSFGKLENGMMVFSKTPIFNFTTPEAKEGVLYQMAFKAIEKFTTKKFVKESDKAK